MLLPFLPRKPHLPPDESSSCVVTIPALSPLRPSTYGGALVELPPKIAVTEECAHLACFLIAEVTAMHSVITRATGSTAIDIRL
jgi:hypothetical protein